MTSHKYGDARLTETKDETIARLAAERDELDFLYHEGGTMEEQLSQAEARVKELEAALDEAIKHKLAMQHRLKAESDNATGWKLRAARLETERDKLLSNSQTDAWILAGYHRICTDHGIAPSSSDLIAAAKEAEQS